MPRMSQAQFDALQRTGMALASTGAAPVRLSPYRSKLEERYAAHLDLRMKCGEVTRWKYEAVTFRYGPDARWKPDFRVVMPDKSKIGWPSIVEYHEVKPKNYMSEAARCRIRATVEQYPEEKFVIVRDTGTKHEPKWEYETV